MIHSLVIFVTEKRIKSMSKCKNDKTQYFSIFPVRKAKFKAILCKFYIFIAQINLIKSQLVSLPMHKTNHSKILFTGIKKKIKHGFHCEMKVFFVYFLDHNSDFVLCLLIPLRKDCLGNIK